MSIYFGLQGQRRKMERKNKGLTSFSSAITQKIKSRVNSFYTWKKQLQVKICFQQKAINFKTNTKSKVKLK